MKKLAFVLVCLFFVIPCQARIIYVDANTPSNNDGSSWSNAYKYLQDALAGANSNLNVDEIRVAKGTYKPDQGAGFTPGDRAATFQLINGVALKGGYASFNKPNPNARDIELYETILSGDLNGNDTNDFYHPSRDENSYHVVTGSGTDKTAVLDGFVITGGKANSAQPHLNGGGMFNNSGSPTITNCIFTGNHAGDCGGGLYNYNGSNPSVSNCIFTGNLSYSGDGIYNYSSKPTVIDCTFFMNVGGDSGGGMYNRDSNTVVTDCIFKENQTWSGAGMYNSASSPVLTNCTFSNNSAGDDGGGIKNNANSNPTLINCIFSENSAGDTGGAMYNYRSSPTLTDCNFNGNSADNEGGGICNYKSSPELTNCTFASNWTSGSGGGMDNDAGSNPMLYQCIFLGNSATNRGGGVANFHSSPTLINCLFEGNSAYSLDGGGGMLNYGSYGNPLSSSNSTLISCTFIGNSATRGGAMTNYCSSPTSVSCTFSGNLAFGNGGGGGIFNSGTSSNPSNSTFINCIFSSNQSTTYAAALNNDEGNPTLINCTIAGNYSPGYCSGLYSDDGILFLTNCILWGNIGSGGQNEGAQIEYGYDTPILDYCCVQGWTSTLNGIGNIGDNPLFLNLNNADPNKSDYRLLPTSPCIDTGDPNYILDANYPTDLDGNPRVINARIDMGVYEIPLGPLDLLIELGESINAMDLNKGTINSLQTKLNTTMQLLEDNNENNDIAAINSLQAFINAVEAQYGSKISEEDANTLIDSAQQIVDMLSAD